MRNAERLAKLYDTVAVGYEEPDVMWIPSPRGPVMLTRRGHYLCDDEGNVIGEVDKSYAEQSLAALARTRGARR